MIEFKPKDVKKAQRKLINNIYIKNIPMTYDDAKINDMFKKYGTIKSSAVILNDKIG